MSQPQKQPLTYRQGLEAVPGSGKEHFADALSTIVPQHLHVRTRIPAIFAMATHSTLGAYIRKDDTYSNPQGVEFKMKTLSGLMGCWQFEYEAMAPSLDGEGRKQVENVLKLAAIGGSDESGVLATSVLNEGSKNLSGKSSKTS